MTVLKHTLDAQGLQEIPENLRSIYEAPTEEGGEYSVPEGLRPIADAITGLFSVNSKIRGENKKLAADAKSGPDLADLADFGSDPKEIAEAVKARIAELEASGTDGERGKQIIDKMRRDMKAAHEAELKGKDDENGALRGTVHKYLIDSAATSALASEGAIAELALPFVQKHVKVIQADGEFHARVVDKDGDVRLSGATGEPMTITELVREMKGQDTYAPLFKSEAHGGGGAKPSASKGAKVPDNLSPTQKIAQGIAARKGQR